MEENEVKIDYVTREDGATLRTQAQEIAARLRKKKEGKKLIYVKHPELPNTWIEKVAKPRGKNFINKKISIMENTATMEKFRCIKTVFAEPMNEFKAVELGYARPNEDNHEWRQGYHVVY